MHVFTLVELYLHLGIISEGVGPIGGKLDEWLSSTLEPLAP